MKKIVIIGGGFAGLWAAFSAVRLARIHNCEDQFALTLINKDEFHGLRPRFYESDLSQTRILLVDFLKPIHVVQKIATVTQIDPAQQKIHMAESDPIDYDRLILATGSQLSRPNIPGLAEYGFDVDTYQAAKKLQTHIQSLAKQKGAGRFTVIVAGGGFTGVEAATDLMDRLKALSPKKVRVIVLDRTAVASRFSLETQAVIFTAFKEMGIETRSNVQIIRVTPDHIELDTGEIIQTQTVVWTAGMQSNALTQDFGVELDRFGRLPVDHFLRIQGIENCFAAGDVAAASTDGTHTTLLSCQHAMPQGRVAGNNAVADLLGEPLTPYEQLKFVTSIDLGSWGALYAEGWDQRIVEVKAPAKKIKLFINHERIYPPTVQAGVDQLLEAAAPVFKSMKF